MRTASLLLAAALAMISTGTAAADAPSWPRTFTQAGNQLVVNQPQFDAWTNRLSLSARAAVVVTPKGGAPVPGTLRFTAQTDTNPAQKTVALSNIQVADGHFAVADPQVAAQATALAKQLVPTGPVTVPLNYLLAALATSPENPVSVQLNTTPPTVFVAEQPTRLVQFDGTPSFAPIANTSIQYALNTNWPVLRSGTGGGYYLLDSTGWMVTGELASGVWQYTDQLPAAFLQLPDTKEWQDVKAAIPAPPVGGLPPLVIDVSTAPAELILIVGAAQYQQVPGTGIYVVQNTDSVVLWDGYAKQYYYLVTGRWFTAPALTGPWTFATGSLPADFSKIPPDGPLAAILASVPGTPEAREAAFAAQIPRLATVSRKTTPTNVTYAGDPQFAPITGTSLSYATNTPSDVIRVGDAYYLCHNGVWFTAAAPTGPWSVAPSVPDPIYTIPSSSPVYNVTYVRVYQAGDDSVTDGYTDGYLGEYVADGVVTWGTGYYYPPYLDIGTVPYYYTRPFTYGSDTFYNPLTGNFCRVGYGYGPYGGFGAASVYNPVTGAYTRGVAAYGPYDSRAVVPAYNPRTGTYTDYARGNPYATWNQGVFDRGVAPVRAESVTTDRGSVTGVETAGGADAIVAHDGDRTGAIVRTPVGDVYAGNDDNLYRRSDDGWQRYDAGDRGDAARGPVVEYWRPAARAGGGYGGEGQVARDDAAAMGDAGAHNAAVYRNLEDQYAARQRADALDRRAAGWGGGDFGRLGGGRFAGGGGGFGGGRR